MRRFYFVSDPTLLEILSLGSDPPSVVPHFQSGLFDSLSNVTFDKVRSCLTILLWSEAVHSPPCTRPALTSMLSADIDLHMLKPTCALITVWAFQPLRTM